MTKEKWFINQLQDALSSINNNKFSLNLAPRAVLIALGKYADKNGECWPLGSHISKLSGVYEKHLHRHYKILKEIKFITVKRKYDQERKMTRNYYKIHLDVILNLSIDENGSIEIESAEKSNQQIERVNRLNIEPISVTAPSKNRTSIELNIANRGCTYSEPTANMADDQPSTLAVGSPYILTTQKTTNKPKDIVQVDHTLTKHGGSVVNIEHDHFFDDFWQCYPRKEKKKEAHKIWVRNKLDQIGEQIINDVRLRQIKHDRWESREFIPLPTSYLNGELWTDEIIERNQNAKSNSNKQQSYIDKLKAAGDIITGNANNVSPLSNYMGRKVDKKY